MEKLDYESIDGYDFNTFKELAAKINEIIDELTRVKALNGIDVDEYVKDDDDISHNDSL